jgi:tetratricopeptide (TPR) repeat protein
MSLFAESAGENYYRSARKAYQAGRNEEAFSLYLLAREVGRDDYWLWYGIAQCHFAAGRIDPALGALGAALVRDANQAGSYILRARIRQRQMRYPDAEKDYAIALRIDPYNSFVCSQYAGLLEQSGHRALAYPYRVQAARLAPNDAHILLAAAKAALALEKFNESKTWCLHASRAAPETAAAQRLRCDLYLAWSDALRQSGEIARARELLSELLAKFPEGDHAEKARARLLALTRLE